MNWNRKGSLVKYREFSSSRFGNGFSFSPFPKSFCLQHHLQTQQLAPTSPFFASLSSLYFLETPFLVIVSGNFLCTISKSEVPKPSQIFRGNRKAVYFLLYTVCVMSPVCMRVCSVRVCCVCVCYEVVQVLKGFILPYLGM